ncbi:MmgE/PrpD family protein [Pelagibacterium nitratireducens]|uniref:MmgE/PrpD family protein n=1 Tax=Pelagibacterium nitratireducens TaxID=1046114 RepID=A0ABZ2I1K6_9HYPH
MNAVAPVQEFETRGQRLAAFISTARGRTYPPDVLEAARKAFVDYLGVTFGSMNDAPVLAVSAAVRRWEAPGKSTVFGQYRTAPALAALVNGTSTHSQDYDDTHPMGAGHPSGPVWSASLAMAEHLEIDGPLLMSAYITGYEVMAKLGNGGAPGGVGRTLQRKGFHPTSIVGRTGAAASVSVLLGLTQHQVGSALGNVATTMGGLLGSFGSHSKPFHAGKAAMDGIMAAQYAAEGYEAAQTLYELEGGWLSAFIQDNSATVPTLDDFGRNWEILGNGFKLFASCRATHASTETARSLAEKVAGRAIGSVHVKTHSTALITAGKLFPKTPLECKFSVPFCVAMGLRGYRLLPDDFVETTLADTSVTELLSKITVEPVPGQPPSEAHVEVMLEDGEVLRASTRIVKGHPDNPLTWDELQAKFESMLERSLPSADIATLFEAAKACDDPHAFATFRRLIGPREPRE